MVLSLSRNKKKIIAKINNLKYITKGGIKWDKIEERNILGNIKEIITPNSNEYQLAQFEIELDLNSIIMKEFILQLLIFFQILVALNHL